MLEQKIMENLALSIGQYAADLATEKAKVSYLEERLQKSEELNKLYENHTGLIYDEKDKILTKKHNIEGELDA